MLEMCIVSIMEGETCVAMGAGIQKLISFYFLKAIISIKLLKTASDIVYDSLVEPLTQF